MKQHRFMTISLVALMLVAGLGSSVQAAPVTAPPGSALTTERRLVDMVAPGIYFPRTEQFDFGFGADLHVPGLDCNTGPAQLNLDYLTFERTGNGYNGTIIFFSAIEPMRELNGNPVNHSIRLILTPPKGDAIVIRQSLTSGRLTVKQGKKSLDSGKDKPVASLAGDRLLVSVPDALGVTPDWSVQAEIDIAGKNPICPYISNTRISSETPPVTVGSLSGEQQNGMITFSPLEATTSSDNESMPAGAKIRSLTMEQNADGTLVVVATMDGEVLDLLKAHSEAFQSLTIALDLASPGFFGVDYPYEVNWNFPMSGKPEPVARIGDPHLGSAVYLGEVPVTIDGDQVRFDFGKFKAYPPDTTGLASSLPAPFGDYGSIFFGKGPHDDPVCLCEGGPALPSDVVLDPDDDVLQYVIIGNLVAISHLKSGETAYGWIDYDGRFLAENDTERYKGVIKLFPLDDSYEVGVQASHLRKLDGNEQTISENLSRVLSGQTRAVINQIAMAEGGNTSPLAQLPPGEWPVDLVTIFQIRVDLDRYEDTDIWNCLHDVSLDSGYTWIDEDTYLECDVIKDRVDTLKFILSQHTNDPAFQQQYHDMLSQTEGMALPPVDDDNIFNPLKSFQEATPVASGVPFPIPFSLVTPYQPAGINPDWAIRAGSFWLYQNDIGGVIRSVTSPFIDSHLLLAPNAPAGSAVRSDPVRGIHDAVVSERRRLRTGRRRRGNGRRDSQSWQVIRRSLLISGH